MARKKLLIRPMLLVTLFGGVVGLAYPQSAIGQTVIRSAGKRDTQLYSGERKPSVIRRSPRGSRQLCTRPGCNAPARKWISARFAG